MSARKRPSRAKRVAVEERPVTKADVIDMIERIVGGIIPTCIEQYLAAHPARVITLDGDFVPGSERAHQVDHHPDPINTQEMTRPGSIDQMNNLLELAEENLNDAGSTIFSLAATLGYNIDIANAPPSPAEPMQGALGVLHARAMKLRFSTEFLAKSAHIFRTQVLGSVSGGADVGSAKRAH